MPDTLVEVGTELVPVDAQQQIAAALEYCNSVVEIANQDEQQNNAASLKLREISEMVKALEKRRKEVKQPYADRATAVDKAFRPVSEALGNLDRRIRAAMSTWAAKVQAELDRQRREAEAKADEERRRADEKAAKEREKAEAYREQGREEMAAKADARADYAVQAAATTVAPVVEAPKAEGASMIPWWTVRVVDKPKAVAECMSNPMLAAAITIDTKFLEKMESEKNVKGGVPIDGCEITYTPRPRVK
jgi:hypothetical protein